MLVNPALKLQKGKTARDNERSRQKSKGESSSHQSTFFEANKGPVADDSGWESGTVEMNGAIGDDANSDYGTNHSLGSPEPQSDLDAQVETEPDDGEDADRDGHDGSNKIKRAKSSLTGSTFLPSLSVGFIQGSYDSDLNDAVETNAAYMPRRNRRGQRARRECVVSLFLESSSL